MSILALQNHRILFLPMSTINFPLCWEPTLFLFFFFLFYFVVALVTVGHECSGLHYLLHKISSSSVSSETLPTSATSWL